MKRRTLNNTEFRPRLPADPFGDAPWVLDLDALSSSSATATTATILVLNTPPPADLAALLCASPALANSLVIIATHDVPVIPAAWQIVPTVRVLKLKEPLFGSTGALGIMSVLDRAARFVSSPRPSTSGKRVQVYVEDPATREFTLRADDQLVSSKRPTKPTNGVETPAKLNKKGSASSMPLLSPPTPAAPTSEKVRNRRTFNFGGFGSSSSSAVSSVASSPASSVLSFNSNSGGTTPITAPSSPMLAAKPLALSQVPSGTRPFDTLIHYILGPPVSPGSLTPPSMQQGSSSAKHLPEKILLKQAILVTTLSAPYLAVPPEPPANLRNGYRSSTIGVSRTRTSSTYESGSLPSSSKKMMASKSVPEGMGGMFKKRRETLPTPVPSLPPLSPAQTSSEGTEEGDINPSKSTSSFKSLKKRFTISRRSTHILEVPPLPVTEDGRLEDSNATLPTSTSLKKRFSILSRSNRSSFLPNADDFATQLEAYAKLQQATLTRYTGRGHIVHVLIEPSDLAALDLPLDRKGKRASVLVPRRPGALVKGIEQFLVAFAYPVQGISASISGSPTISPSPSFKSPPSSPDMKSQAPGDKTKPIPFIVRGGTLGAVFKLNGVGATLDQLAASEQDDERKVSLAECVIFGGLDGGERHGSWKAWLDVAGSVLIKDAGQVKMDPRTIEDMVGVQDAVETKELEEWDQKREERIHHKASASLSAGMNAAERKMVSGDGDGYGSPPSSAPSPVHLAPPPYTRSSSLPRSSSLSPTTLPNHGTIPLTASPTAPPARPITLLTPRASLSPPLSIPRTAPLSSVDERYRQPVAQPHPDLKFHLPKARSGATLRAENVAIHVEQAQPTPPEQRRSRSGSGVWADDSRNTNTTGLLTPPESRTSVSSEEDLNLSCEGGSGEGSLARSVVSAAPPQVELGSLGSGLNLSVRSGEVGKSESFDFVKAYMYDPNKLGSQDSSPASSPEVVQRGHVPVPVQEEGGGAEKRRDGRGEEELSRPRGAGTVEGRQDEGQEEVRTDKSEHGHHKLFVPIPAKDSSHKQRSKALNPIITSQTTATATRDLGARSTGVTDISATSPNAPEAVMAAGRPVPAREGGVSEQDAQEYANALRKYRGELNSALHSGSGVVADGAPMGQDGSRQSISSLGSGKSGKSGSLHELSMVDGARGGGCSMAGIPPVKMESMSAPAAPVREEELKKERRKSWRWKAKTKEGGVEVPAIPQTAAQVAPRVRHSSLPHSASASSSGASKKYHYSKPVRSPGARPDQAPPPVPVVQQPPREEKTHILAEPVKTVKAKRSTGLRGFVGKLFGGGHQHQGGTAGVPAS